MATRPEQLYGNDFFAWTRDPAKALRRLADERWNGPLDTACPYAFDDPIADDWWPASRHGLRDDD